MPRRTLTDERDALQAKLAEVEAKIAAQEREKLAEIGSAILDVLDKDSDLKSRVMNALDQNVKGKRKREILGLTIPNSGSTGQTVQTTNSLEHA